VQAAGAYGAAAGVMGSAGEIAQKAATTLANQYATEQSFAMQQQQIAAQSQLAQQQLELQQRSLQEQIRQRQIEIDFAERQMREQGQTQMWGAIPVLGPLINIGRGMGGGGGGTYICTELLRQGRVHPQVYAWALCFDANLSADTIAGYQWWAEGISRKMKKSRWTTDIAGIFAGAYMRYASARVLGLHRPWFGRAIYLVGAPVCNVLGKIRKSFFMEKKLEGCPNG
jgi:hypothetical protein